MRYKVTDNSIIQENHILPFTVNWKTSLGYIFIWTPGLICLYYTCFAIGWDHYENGIKTGPTGISNFALVFLIIAFFGTFLYTGITEKFPINLKKSQEYSIYYFNKEHLDIPLYKEAYEECIRDIKANSFDEDEWNNIFKGLSREAERLKEGEKQIKKINIPKRDFAGELKDSNDMYLKGLK